MEYRNDRNTSCSEWCWRIAIVVGVVVTAMLLLGSVELVEAALFGLPILVFTGTVLTWLLCDVGQVPDELAPVTAMARGSSAETVTRPAPPSAAPFVSAPAPTPKAKEPPKAASTPPETVSEESVTDAGAVEEVATSEPETASEDAAEDPGTQPETLSAPRDGGPDNLKEIKGVGPKLEALLHSMGFYHFDQVANWTPQEVAWVDQNLQGFKGRVSRDGWVEQAKILAAGGQTEFSRKVEDGGVYD